MAFSPDGRELWVAHGKSGIEVRDWPALELQRVIPEPCLCIVAHPSDEGFATVGEGLLCLRAPNGTVTAQTVVPTNTDGIALHESGDVFAAGRTEGDDGQLRVHRIDVEARSLKLLGETALRRPYWWDLCLLPSCKRVIVAVNDRAAETWDWTAERAMPIPDKWAGVHTDRRSWLTCDSAADERAVIVSQKSGLTHVLWLDSVGEVTESVQLRKVAFPRPSYTKQPHRGSRHAMHPHEDTVVFTDISGRMFVSDGRTGAMLREVAVEFAAGYVWDSE